VDLTDEQETGVKWSGGVRTGRGGICTPVKNCERGLQWVPFLTQKGLSMKTRYIGLCYVSVIMVIAGLFQAQKQMAAQTLESPSDALSLIALTSANAGPSNVSEARRQQVAASYAKLPLGFETNRGQSDPRVKFLACGSGYSLFLTSNEVVLALKRASQESKVQASLRQLLADQLFPKTPNLCA
jgi:hypothetical protein